MVESSLGVNSRKVGTYKQQFPARRNHKKKFGAAKENL